jgi:F-type H+-transporting ATPase subunit b
MPANAGKVFDFNATLPIMAAQFLLLMVFLDKTWFGPVGKVLDARDAMIRARLTLLKTDAGELETLQKEADTLLKDARADAQAKIAAAKNVAATNAEAKLAAEKTKLDGELAIAIKDLEADKTLVQKEIDQQVSALSNYIVQRVLPAGFSL